MRTRHVTAGLLRIAAATLAVVLVGWPAPAAWASDAAQFPSGYEPYHTYAEVVAVLDETVASFPHLARKVSIGKSHEGRDIWALLISNDPTIDQAKPEILSVSLTHAREHITTEMNVYLIRELTTMYATDPRIRAIVDSREIWIIPVMNPDGQLWDIASGSFLKWRKNRQPIPDSTEIGVDLNRNFGFMWNCCRGGSNKPESIVYRGPYPWFGVENRRLRDFIESRVVNGRQQIKAILNWHSYGEFILWPYGYTLDDVPKTMSADDHAAMVALGKRMARTNGYKAMQGSDMAIYDGDFMAWAYGEQRIIGFTFEMYPRHNSKLGGFYPPPEVIERETTRNRKAVLYLLEQADCVYRSAGLATTHCGPLNDDFETGRGWMVNPAGTDAATGGQWERAIPDKTSTAKGVKQRSATPSGRYALVTGAAAGAKASSNDVDGGVTSVRSPGIALGAGSGWRVTFSSYFAHNAKATKADYFRVSVIHAGGRTTVFEQRGTKVNRNAKWVKRTLSLDAFAGQTIRLLFEAADNAADSLIEAAVDDVRVYRLPN